LALYVTNIIMHYWKAMVITSTADTGPLFSLSDMLSESFEGAHNGGRSQHSQW